MQSWSRTRLTQLKLLFSLYGLESVVEFQVFDNACELHICIRIQLSIILQQCFVKKWVFDVHIGQHYSVHEKWFSHVINCTLNQRNKSAKYALFALINILIFAQFGFMQSGVPPNSIMMFQVLGCVCVD